MTTSQYSSFAQWYNEGPCAAYVHTMSSPGGILNLYGSMQPPQEMQYPAVPDLVVHQNMTVGTHLSASLGAGAFAVAMEVGGCVVAAPNFAIDTRVPSNHQVRSVAFPVAQWANILDEASEGKLTFDILRIYRGAFVTPTLQGKLRKLWAVCAEQGAPSILLARAAGCEILAELCQLSDAALPVARGGLAPRALRRCVELIHARLSDEISLDELACEAGLSSFHFARMFKQSLGVPPRVYVTRLRMERACDLLEQTDIPVNGIALQVGYSSHQALAKVFTKSMNITPSDYRRVVRDAARSIPMP